MRLSVVSGTDLGAQEFIDAAWQGGELFVDDEEIFKRALGGEKYKSRWLLKPSVMRKAVSFTKSAGASMADVTHEKTQMLGGTLIVDCDGQVLHEFQETTTFHNGDAQTLLDAVRARAPPSTPTQAEACQ